MPNVTAYISTSVDDCRVSLSHVKDLEFCRRLLAECQQLRGQVSRIRVIKTRIRQLEKEART
jgi:hypothetical protein